jgi:hypothetical protein
MELPPVLNLPEESQAATPATPPRDSQYAVASMVTGILGWTLVPLLGSVAAIITGHLAKKEINESRGAIGGSSMATAGLILGYVQLGFVVIAIAFAIILMVVAEARWMS